MDAVPIKPERKAQLEEYAQRHGQDTGAALDDALAAYLERERPGRTMPEAAKLLRARDNRPASEFLEKLECEELVNRTKAQEAVARILELRKDNILPDGVTIHDLIHEGRA